MGPSPLQRQEPRARAQTPFPAQFTGAGGGVSGTASPTRGPSAPPRTLWPLSAPSRVGGSSVLASSAPTSASHASPSCSLRDSGTDISLPDPGPEDPPRGPPRRFFTGKRAPTYTLSEAPTGASVKASWRSCRSPQPAFTHPRPATSLIWPDQANQHPSLVQRCRCYAATQRSDQLWSRTAGPSPGSAAYGVGGCRGAMSAAARRDNYGP